MKRQIETREQELAIISLANARGPFIKTAGIDAIREDETVRAVADALDWDLQDVIDTVKGHLEVM